jgi:hypothetical protein
MPPCTPAVRVNGNNLNHHLWNNNGTWWMHYTIYPTPITKERVRRSLRTNSIEEARRRRDAILRDVLRTDNQTERESELALAT